MARAGASQARSNSILAALPDRDFDRLRPHPDPVDLPLGAALFEAGSRVQQLYFPASCIVSLLYVLADGASAEIADDADRGMQSPSLRQARVCECYAVVKKEYDRLLPAAVSASFAH